MSIFAELKRRNVFRVGAAYLVVAWLLMQVTDTLVPALHLPGWIVTAVALFLIIGLPLALVFAWAFELTPEGLKREAEVKPAESIRHRTGRKLDYLIIGALVLALGYFAYDKLLLGPERDAALVETTKQAFQKQADAVADAQKSIAVLPFTNMSARQPRRDQQNLLSAMVDLELSDNVKTVGEAIAAVLENSDYRLAPNSATPCQVKLFELPLPAVHRRLGPLTLRQALEVLSGPAYRPAPDPLHRLVYFERVLPEEPNTTPDCDSD